jgi:coenzyme F420-0:L-glutamate ligase / coenzyme F420-1:gamma-L-glutamate ligase
VTQIVVRGISGVPEVREGDDLAKQIVDAAGPGSFEDGDVIVIAQKVVSKCEGRSVPAADKKDVIASESARVLRRTATGMIISETRHGLVCANAGVDASNVIGDSVLLLPLDPDLSARRLRAQFKQFTGVDVAVIVSDTFGRAWRLGQTNVAIGVAGMDAFTDYRGRTDTQGRPLLATRICTADEIAGAAELVMGKSDGVCAAVVRGATIARGRGSGAQIPRPPAEDLFR